GASQFIATGFFISTRLQPGEDRAWKTETVSTVSTIETTKPLKRLGVGPPAHTGLKPGVNESLHESEMRPDWNGARIVLNPQRLDGSEVLRVETTRAPVVSLKCKSAHYRILGDLTMGAGDSAAI